MVLQFLALFISPVLYIQSQGFPEKIYFDEYVECYYPKGVEQPLYIYDTYEGSSVDSLMDGTKYQWYKMALSESKGKNWFRIENLIQMPDSPIREFPDYKGMWVHSDQLKLFVPDLGENTSVCFFEEPDVSTAVVYKTTRYMKLELIGVREDWARVKFVVNGKTRRGWIMRQDQCASPWTNCTLAGGSCDN